MALEGWYSHWYAGGYFPAVWFAPGDESGVPPDELQPNFLAEVELSFKRPRKWYVKRKKQLHIFDTAEEADSFIRAADEADKAIERAKSKSAKKRVLRKVYEVVKPAEIIDVDHVAHLVSLYGLQFDIPSLLEQQDWEMFAHVAAMAQEIEEEELLLLA